MAEEPKRRGRPPLDAGEASTSVNVRMNAHDYDQVSEQARRARMSVPAVIRWAVDRYLADRKASSTGHDVAHDIDRTTE